MTIRDKLIDEFETEREEDEERIRQEELQKQEQAQEATTPTEKAPEDYNLGDNVKELGVIKGTLSSLIFGTAEDAFKENPREQD